MAALVYPQGTENQEIFAQTTTLQHNTWGLSFTSPLKRTLLKTVGHTLLCSPFLVFFLPPVFGEATFNIQQKLQDLSAMAELLDYPPTIRGTTELQSQ